MNNFEFENQLGTVHLVYHIQPQEQVDTFVLGMLCNNDIHGVAKTIFTQIDSDRFVKYNADGGYDIVAVLCLYKAFILVVHLV